MRSPSSPPKHGVPIATETDTRLTNVRPLALRPLRCHAVGVQAVYFRGSTKKPWELVRRTRSVADAEQVIRATAARKRSGKLLYLEARSLPTTVWDMRGLEHRKLGSWLVKELRTDFSKVKQGGRKAWQPSNPGQRNLFG